MTNTQSNAILETKKQIQDIVSKLMDTTTTATNDLTEEETKLIETIVETIGKYKVANQTELTKLSEAFGDVLESLQTTNTDS